MNENEIGKIVVDAAVKLHMATGPGLFESVYEVLLSQMLAERGLRIERQVIIPIQLDGLFFKEGFRADIIVEKKVIIELKSVEKTCPAHNKQLLTYLKLSGVKLGFLLNFGEPRMKDGITRLINGSL
ncbi:GxxExxY protein [Puniceicoccales bacterium CK1056]|uniref:GxxExxY protein n=1 Tax=Oceanipulchritudo coccoides TaxID=2706888 RepID=A0A6B2LZT6_9BACT|nr:GxxExxY protein [Oceanipulchritudo coccoides]NDV61662.1 GxxExxY protein [Oceanipulchritudo coccoides]